MKRLPFLLFLMAVSPAALPAQERIAAASQQAPFVPQHELRLSAGAWPLLPYKLGQGCDADRFTGFDRLYRGPLYTAGAWSLSYDYRIKKWFDLGLTLSYYSEYSSSFRWSYRDEAWSLVGRNRAHAITVMPAARFTWVNTRWVRMYSTLGLGATIECGDPGHGDDSYRDVSPAFQFTPIGIAVGRSLFGFAEIGCGAQGCFLLGIGYRFKPKTD